MHFFPVISTIFQWTVNTGHEMKIVFGNLIIFFTRCKLILPDVCGCKPVEQNLGKFLEISVNETDIQANIQANFGNSYYFALRTFEERKRSSTDMMMIQESKIEG